MTRHRQRRHRDGTAWLVADRDRGDYLCYWYTGANDAHLVEQARATSDDEAVAWGRQRTSRVRIRTADARTAWAGSAPAPEGFADRWTAPVSPDTIGTLVEAHDTPRAEPALSLTSPT